MIETLRDFVLPIMGVLITLVIGVSAWIGSRYGEMRREQAHQHAREKRRAAIAAQIRDDSDLRSGLIAVLDRGEITREDVERLIAESRDL
jgi:hypothetical protein